MKLISGLAVLVLLLVGCNGGAPTTPTSTLSSTIVTPTTITSVPTTRGGTSTTVSPPPETTTFDWPRGTVTCSEIEGNFPQGVDDHRILLDEGLVSYYRASGEDSVEEVFIQFLDDPTCSAGSEAWLGIIQYLVNPESLERAGLCDFYSSLSAYDPPPENLDTVMSQLASAEQLCI